MRCSRVPVVDTHFIPHNSEMPKIRNWQLFRRPERGFTAEEGGGRRKIVHDAPLEYPSRKS